MTGMPWHLFSILQYIGYYVGFRILDRYTTKIIYVSTCLCYTKRIDYYLFRIIFNIFSRVHP